MSFRHDEVGLDTSRVPHDRLVHGVVPVRVGPHFQLAVAIAQPGGAALEPLQVRLAQVGRHGDRDRVEQHELGLEGLGQAGSLVHGR